LSRSLCGNCILKNNINLKVQRLGMNYFAPVKLTAKFNAFLEKASSASLPLFHNHAQPKLSQETARFFLKNYAGATMAPTSGKNGL